MLPITKNITSVNKTVKSSRAIKYIVIHWVGAVSTAANNATYFKSTYRGASAHYFVDDNTIYQVVEDKDVAWHCGANTYFHSTCRNANSIGIEMCLKTSSTISAKTIANTAELVKYLMNKYNIPESNVLRHYDVTHKSCPAPYVNATKWKTLKTTLTGETDQVSVTVDNSKNPYDEPTRILYKGCNGDDVKWLQFQLNRSGKFDLEVDGKFGNGTKGAVGVVQSTYNLVVDYKVGPKTRAVLKQW